MTHHYRKDKSRTGSTYDPYVVIVSRSPPRSPTPHHRNASPVNNAPYVEWMHEPSRRNHDHRPFTPSTEDILRDRVEAEMPRSRKEDVEDQPHRSYHARSRTQSPEPPRVQSEPYGDTGRVRTDSDAPKPPIAGEYTIYHYPKLPSQDEISRQGSPHAEYTRHVIYVRFLPPHSHHPFGCTVSRLVTEGGERRSNAHARNSDPNWCVIVRRVVNLQRLPDNTILLQFATREDMKYVERKLSRDSLYNHYGDFAFYNPRGSVLIDEGFETMCGPWYKGIRFDAENEPYYSTATWLEYESNSKR
jgi:hypothetical protein